MKATRIWILIILLLIPIILFGTDALAMLRETEPNNTLLQANEFQLTVGEFAGQLYSDSDVDVFKFNVSTQGVLSFSIKPGYSTIWWIIRFSSTRFKFIHFVKPGFVLILPV